MKKIYLKKPQTKQQALEFTKALLSSNEEESIDNTSNHDPKSKLKFGEASAQSVILNYLIFEEVQGRLFVQRTNNAAIYDTSDAKFRRLGKGVHKGFPDILVIKNGRIIFLEIKSNNGKQSKEQQKIEQKILQQGAEYYIVRSLDFLTDILRNDRI